MLRTYFTFFRERVLPHFRGFYRLTLTGWVLWMLFVDDNRLGVVWSNYMKLKELEREKEYYQEQVIQVRREQKEVMGNLKQIEKWAREKYYMRKPTEEVYIIVNEKGVPIDQW